MPTGIIILYIRKKNQKNQIVRAIFIIAHLGTEARFLAQKAIDLLTVSDHYPKT